MLAQKSCTREPLPFTFDEDKLTLAIHLDGVYTLDLTSITESKAPFRWDGKSSPPDAWFQKNGFQLRRAIQSAAWKVFSDRRDRRKLMFDETPLDFEIFKALKGGATLDWNLGAITWPDQKRHIQKAMPYFEIKVDQDDDGGLILERYLCPGGSLVLVGPTGIGKSSLAMQLCACLALSRHCFGLEPARPLAVLVIQAENDVGDLQEQRQGIVEGLNLSEQEQATLNEQLAVATVDDVSGSVFFARLVKLIRQWQPDVVLLDPLNAYIGGDLNRQDIAADFLRHRLNPILHRGNIGAIIIHHTGKPPRDPRDQGGNPDYAGLGSSELSNWARAICSLTIEGNAFCLTLGKRGKRAGIVDQFGTTRVWLRHAENLICWRECDPATVSSPKKAKVADDLLAQVPASPALVLKDTLIYQKAKAAGIGEKLAKTLLNQLISEGRVFEHHQKRSRTNALKMVARHPQNQSGTDTTNPELAADENQPF